MKIFNRQPGRFVAYWNAEDKIDDKGKPQNPQVKFVIEGNRESPDLPPHLAEKLLVDWPRKFTADKKAVEAEIQLRDSLETAGKRVADLENYILEVRGLIGAAGDRKNRAAAQKAAEELDRLLSGFSPGGTLPGKAPATPAPAPRSIAPVETPAPAPAGPADPQEFERAEKHV